MSTTTMNVIPAPESKGGRWMELALGVTYLMGVGIVFTGVVALVAALFTGS